MAFKSVDDGENIPVPELLQIPVPAPPTTVPAKATVSPSQIAKSSPALITGACWIVIVIASEAPVQPPFP